MRLHRKFVDQAETAVGNIRRQGDEQDIFVRSRAIIEQVVPVTAEIDIDPVVADQRVVAGSRLDEVVAVVAIDGVGAAVTEQQVVACGPGDVLGLIIADEHVDRGVIPPARRRSENALGQDKGRCAFPRPQVEPVKDLGGIRFPTDKGEVLLRGQPRPPLERVEPPLIGLGKEGVPEFVKVDGIELGREAELVLPQFFGGVEGQRVLVVSERENTLARVGVVLNVLNRQGARILHREVGQLLGDIPKERDAQEDRDRGIKGDVFVEHEAGLIRHDLAELVHVVEERPDRRVAERAFSGLQRGIGDGRFHRGDIGALFAVEALYVRDRVGDIRVEPRVPHLLADLLPSGLSVVSGPDEMRQQRLRVECDGVSFPSETGDRFVGAPQQETRRGQEFAKG